MSNTQFFGDIALGTFAAGTGGAVYKFKGNTDDTATSVSVDVKEKANGLAAWGVNNDYPQKIAEAVRKNGSASSGLRFLRKAHYGNGMTMMRHEVTEQGKHDYKVVPMSQHPEIAAFFNRSQVSRFSKEIIMDLEWWSIAFPEYILSNDYNKITRVKRQTAAWCRFELMNETTGLVENIYISQKFGSGSSVSLDSEWVAKVPLIDSYWSAEEVKEYCKKKKIHNFIRPVFYPLLTEAYYPIAEWHSIYNSGWLDVANSVPEYKMNLFKNQVSVKYLIEVDERYFEKVYTEDWYKFTVDERKAIRNELINTINEHLSGNTNAGKSILSMKIIVDGKAESAITITSIDDKFKDGSYLPEAEAANSEALFGQGVDPSLIGAGIPGGKLGAGSGSDKVSAYNILSSQYKTNRETSAEPVDFVRDYNGWDPTLIFSYENTILTTLDKNPTGSQKTS